MDIRELGTNKNKKATGTSIPNVVPSIEPKVKPEAEAPVEAPVGAQEDSVVTEMREELSAMGYADTVYFSMLDTLMTGGEYIWDFLLFDRVPCKLRIRPDWVNQLRVKRMEVDAPKTMVRFADMLNRYNLAGAIVQYGDGRFELENEEALTEILEHLGKLPFVVINALITELVKFDKITTVAMSPWAIKNFIKPQSEK